MRDYGKVFSRIWESEDFRSMSEDGRALVLYLLTCQHGTIAGVFRVPDGYACEDLQWSPERVALAFSETLRKGFANRCETSKWVWVVKFLQWNPPENPNQRKSALKMAHAVPDGCVWKQEFMRACGEVLAIPAPEIPNPQPTVPKPLLNQKQEQKQKQEKEIPPGFARFWSAWPKHERKVAKGKCMDVWVKAKAEPHADRIVAHIERLKTSQGWTKDNGAFIPEPLTYLNKRKWEGAGEGDDASAWWATAGFTDRFSAENAGCRSHNVLLFRDGARIPEPAA